MSQPDILRHSGPHQVTVAEGSKNAQSRQAVERSALEDRPSADFADIRSHEHPDPASDETQLSEPAADSSDDWYADDDMSLRMDQLKQHNLALAQRLQRLTKSGRKEEKNE
jgi:hypothetical protein